MYDQSLVIFLIEIYLSIIYKIDQLQLTLPGKKVIINHILNTIYTHNLIFLIWARVDHIRKKLPFLYPNRTLSCFFVTSANWWCGHFQFSSIAFRGVAIGKDTRPLIPYMKNFPLKLANPQFNNGFWLFVCILLRMCRINYIRHKIWTMLIEYKLQVTDKRFEENWSPSNALGMTD